MSAAFYERLNEIEALLADNFQMNDLGQGAIEVNGIIIDTNQQFEMLTPTFFTASAGDNPVIQKFKMFFEQMGVLPKGTPNIPVIRDIPLRAQTVNDQDGRQRAVFAAFLEREILVNQWAHLFPDAFASFRTEILACFTEHLAPLEEKLITYDKEGNLLASGGYRVERHHINGVDLWLRAPESRSEKDILAAVDRTLNDTDNTRTIAAALTQSLSTIDKLAFNVRDVGVNCFSVDDIQNRPRGGGHQFFLMLDRTTQTIYGINNTAGAGDVNFLFFKDQIDIFLKSIGDNTNYRFQLFEGKSRQPSDKAYLEQVCGISQFCHYAALLSGVRADKIQDEVPARVTTLMYLLQYAVINQHQALLDMLSGLGDVLNEKMAEAVKHQHQYIVTGRGKVDAMLQDILKAAEETAQKEQASGRYHGDIERHGDVYAARTLTDAFHNHLKALECGGETLDSAQKALFSAIQTARLNLTTHHQMTYLLANLAAAVLTLGIVPIATRLYTGQWAFFRPLSAWKLDTIEQDTKDLDTKNNPF